MRLRQLRRDTGRVAGIVGRARIIEPLLVDEEFAPLRDAAVDGESRGLQVAGLCFQDQPWLGPCRAHLCDRSETSAARLRMEDR